MILGEEKEVVADNNFCKAYNALKPRHKQRVKEAILTGCQISETRFYQWLKRPEEIKSYNDRRFIAFVVFDKDPVEFFPKLQIS